MRKCISILVHFQNQEDVSRGVELRSNFGKVGMLITGKFQKKMKLIGAFSMKQQLNVCYAEKHTKLSSNILLRLVRFSV